jgi:hypothetical protein
MKYIYTICKKTNRAHDTNGFIFYKTPLDDYMKSFKPMPYCALCGEPMVKPFEKANPKEILLGKTFTTKEEG